MTKNNKKAELSSAGIILLLFSAILAIGMFASGIDSKEIDEICNNTNNILQRNTTEWTCKTMQECTTGQYLTYNGSNYQCVDDQASSINGTGVGTTGYLAKWETNNTINNSVIYQNGTNIGIGTSGAVEKLTIKGNVLIKNSVDNNAYMDFDTGLTSSYNSLLKFSDQGTVKWSIQKTLTTQ